MSLPFYKITCTGCDYEDGYSYGTHYVYEGIAEHEPVLRAAWCSDCGKIVNACVPFTSKDAEEEIADLNLWIDRNKSGFFSRFSKSKKNEILKTEKEKQAIRARLEYFENTAYVSKCLSCGGSHVFPFYLPYGEYGEVEELNVMHSCGGRLLVSMEGRFSFASRRKVVYDETGEILHDGRVQNA